jgi:hypothetical protein
MKHVQTFESFMDKDSILEGATVKIGSGKNLHLKRTKDGVKILRIDYNGGLPAEEITIFNEELEGVKDFLNSIK